jgi:hypothetical protein
VTAPQATEPRRPGAGGCLIGLGVLAFAAVMTTVILAIGIWPGEAKLVAPLLCPDDQPDAFVVSDTYSVQPGETSTTFTLYCMGERGQHTEVGFFVPFMLLTVLHAAIYVALVLLLVGRGALRRRGQVGEPPQPPPPPPPSAEPQPVGTESDLPPAGPLIS